MGGGGKGRGFAGAEAASESLADIAESVFEETAPIRGQTLERLESTLGGNFPAGPVFEAQKLATEQQFDRARERTIASAPRGGALTGALGDVESARAATLAGITGDIFQRDVGAAQAAAFGAPPVAISGLGSAAGTQAALAQAQAGQKGATAQALGQGAGIATGLALKP